MVINDFLAYRLNKEYEKSALKQAENARLVKIALQHRNKRSPMRRFTQFAQDQWKKAMSSIRRDKPKKIGSSLPKQHVPETR